MNANNRSSSWLSAFLLVFLCGFANASEAPMPLPAHMSELYKYYQLAWLPDHYPGKQMEHGVVAHPIYGTYVIYDYLNEWRKSGDPAYLHAARIVADAALARMEKIHGARAFYYTPEMGLTQFSGTFYSALTQARWVDALDKLAETTKDDRYRKARDEVLLSLTIPVKKGGVLKEVAGGITLEEYPSEIPTYTLNGWLSTLVVLQEQARKGSRIAINLLERNLVALEAMLPLYDLSEIANSRYQLTNRARIRFKGARVSNISVEIPGEGRNGLSKEKAFTNHILKAEPDGRMKEANVILSYISFPKPNVLHITGDEDGELKVEMGTSDYNPRTTALPVKQWKELGIYRLKKGQTIAVPIPWQAAHLVAYPTAFTKQIGGKYYNAYHFIHIKQLDRLYASTGRKIFKHYADKWRMYPSRWASMPMYVNAPIELTRYKTPADPD